MMAPLIEEWQEIPQYPKYEVSNWGRVRRLEPYRSTIVGKLLKPDRQRGGYLLFRLGGKAVSAHRLVAMTFIGPPPTAIHLAAHGDGIRSHNWPGNLSWKTPKENAADRVRHGTAPVGEKNPRAILSDIQVQLIRARAAFLGESKAGLSRLFNVSDTHIGRIITGEMRRSAGGYLG